MVCGKGKNKWYTIRELFDYAMDLTHHEMLTPFITSPEDSSIKNFYVKMAEVITKYSEIFANKIG